jgi:hypothetical protein
LLNVACAISELLGDVCKIFVIVPVNDHFCLHQNF